MRYYLKKKAKKFIDALPQNEKRKIVEAIKKETRMGFLFCILSAYSRTVCKYTLLSRDNFK